MAGNISQHASDYVQKNQFMKNVKKKFEMKTNLFEASLWSEKRRFMFDELTNSLANCEIFTEKLHFN